MPNPVYFEITRAEGGPLIEVLSPEAGKSYKSPINIKVKFVPSGGFDIDLATFKVEYMKFIAIDLTSRVKDYVSKEGIDVPDAKLPSGTHTIRLSVGGRERGTYKTDFHGGSHLNFRRRRVFYAQGFFRVHGVSCCFSAAVYAADFPAKEIYETYSPSVVVIRASGEKGRGMIGGGLFDIRRRSYRYQRPRRDGQG